jgi:hypothetical protein
VPSSSKINLAPSLFSPLLTASTTSRCRPSPSQHETYVIRVTRPAGILRASSKCREVCFAGPGRVRLARLHRVNTYERILQKCMKLPRLDCMLIGSGRSRGLSLVAGPISSSFCMSTAIRNISADAERCDARTVSNHQPVEDNVLNPEASTIRQARQYKDWSNKNCRRCRHTTFALQYEMTRIIPTSGVFGARKTWSSLSECLSPSSVSSSFCSCSSLSFFPDRVARLAGGLNHLGAGFGRCGVLNVRLFVTRLLTTSCAQVRTQSFARLLRIVITPFVCEGGFGRGLVLIV